MINDDDSVSKNAFKKSISKRFYNFIKKMEWNNNSRVYQKNIAKFNVQNDRSQKCLRTPETIHHMTLFCPILASRDDLERHGENLPSAELLQEKLPNDLYTPKDLLQNAQYTYTLLGLRFGHL